MSKSACKNPKCNNRVKGTGKFCSIPCFGVYKKLFPKEYKKGVFKKGVASVRKGKRTTKVGDTKLERLQLKSGERRDRRLIFVGQYQKNGQPKYIRHDKYVWLLENGPIPKGKVLWHKDGRTLNDDIKNLETIPFGIALSRYSLHKKKIFNLSKKSHIQKIIDGCVRGDRRIQQQLYEMMYGKMMAVAWRYSNKKSVAEDILSDAFVKVFTRINTVDVNRGNLEGWIRSIVVFTGIDYIRRYNKINFLTDSIDDTFDDEENSDHIFNKISKNEDFSEKIDGEYILKMIQDLSPAYQLVFNLSVVEGLQHKEIAEKLGISEGTSKSNLSKAKKNLQEKIIKRYSDDEEKILFLENYYEPEGVSYA